METYKRIVYREKGELYGFSFGISVFNFGIVFIKVEKISSNLFLIGGVVWLDFLGK